MSLLIILSCNFNISNKITIRFWNGFTGPDGRTILKIIKEFNAKNPDINVIMQKMDWGTYYNKLFVAGIGKRAPEAFVIHAGQIERFLDAKFLSPIDDLINGDDGIDTNDFDENVWAAVERNKKHYALPLDVHILGLYYNKKLFKEANIVDSNGNPKPPTNMSEFTDALARLTKDTNGDGKTDNWGMVYTWYRTNLYTIMCQFGGQFFSPDGKKCLLNCQENIDALQFCVDLIQKYKYVPSPANFDNWIGFRQGKVGMALEGIYMLSDLTKQKDLDFAGTPAPIIGKTRAVWADSHTICIKKGMDEKKTKATWKFIKYLSDNSLDWAEGGQIPVRKSLRNSERFNKMTVQSEFAKQIPYIRYCPRIPFIFEFFMEFDACVEKALLGSVTPEEALDKATQRIDEVIARMGEMKK